MPEIRRISSDLALWGLRPAVRLAARSLLDCEVTGRENLPEDDPVVLAANHFSHLDPPIVGMLPNRAVRFIAVDELFGNHVAFDAFTKFFGAIPTDRDGVPFGALKEAIRHLVEGGIVGLFPEGRRVLYWGENEPKRGAAWLAWMTGAPLVPIAIHGTEGALGPREPGVRRTAVRVWVGPPLWWFEYADRVDPVGAMTEAWRRWIDDRLAAWG
jgi:1-acyl-sn-glycerol-3-phosphate acyltransferase